MDEIEVIEGIEEMDGMEELERNPLCPPDITSGGKENPPSLPFRRNVGGE